MHFAIVKIMVEVDPVWQRLPLTSSHIEELLHVCYFVPGDEPRAERAEGVMRLALGPLTARSIWK